MPASVLDVSGAMVRCPIPKSSYEIIIYSRHSVVSYLLFGELTENTDSSADKTSTLIQLTLGRCFHYVNRIVAYACACVIEFIYL